MLFPRQPPAPPPRHQFNQAEAMECEQNNMNEVREQELEETNTEIAHCQSEDRTHYTAEENEVTNTKSGNATSAFTSLSIPSPSSLSSNVSYNSLNVNDRFTSWSNNPSSEIIMKILQRTREPAPPPPQLSSSETVETNHTTTSTTATTLPETEEPKSESIFSKFNFKNIGLALFSSSPEEDEEEQEAHKKQEEEEQLQESKRRENKLGDQAKNKKENNSKTWNSLKMSKFKDVRQRPSVQVMQRPTRKGSRVEATPSSSSSLAKGVNSRINTHRNKPTNNNNSTSSSMADKNKIGATEKLTTQSKNKTPLAKKTCTGVSATTNLEHVNEDKEVTAVPELQSKTHKLKLDNAKSNKRIGHRRNSSSLSSNSDSSLSLSSSSSTSLSSLTSNSNSSSSSTSSLGLSTTSLTGDKEHTLQNVKKTKELTKSEKRVSFGDTSSQTHPKNAHHRHSHHSKQHHHHHNRKNNNNKNSNDKKLNQSPENISLSSSTSSLSSTSSSSISSLSSSSLLPEHPSSSSSTAHSQTKSGKHKHKHKNRHKHQHHQSSNSTGGGTEVGSRRRSLGASAKSDGNGHDNEKATSSSSFAANATQNINAAPSAPPVLSFRDRVHKGVAPPSRKRVIRKRNASEPRPPTNITGPVDTFRVGQGTRRSALARRNNNLNSNNNKDELKNVSTLSLLPERLRRRYFHVLLHVAQF